MRNRIPPAAFEFYASLGVDRSYAKVAKRFGVTKRAILRCAKREDWQRRIDELDLKARDASEKRAVESIEQMNDRHLRAMKIIQAKALEALKSHSLESAMDAIRALDLASRTERVIRGQPGDRSVVSIEEIVRTEYERWLVVPAVATASDIIREVKADELPGQRDARTNGGRKLITSPRPETVANASNGDDNASEAEQDGALS